MTSTGAYYNEYDKKTAQWIKKLIENKQINRGQVDERSIIDVKPEDIKGYSRIHWFAGIGTWDYALNRAGWGDREIWTASLPCQPFSSAGKRKGKDDERHLLPHFLELVNQCKPATIIGEQVASAVSFGWIDDLQAELEAQGYAFGFIVLGAHSIGAPHIRQRLYWVANASGIQCIEQVNRCSDKTQTGEASGINSSCGGMGDTKGERFGETGASIGRPKKRIAGAEYSHIKWIKCADGKQRPIKPGIFPLAYGVAKGMVCSGDSVITPNDTQECRVMRLKGYGNAIQADIAIEFIKAVMDSI